MVMIAISGWVALQVLTVIGIWLFVIYIPDRRVVKVADGVVVIITVKGVWKNAHIFLSGIAAQAGTGFRLIIACPRCSNSQFWYNQVMSNYYGSNITIIMVDDSFHEGQKIHKLRSALASLGAADRYVVFIDTDIEPPPNLVGRLIFPLVTGKSQISTGYRLTLPRKLGFLSLLLSAVDLQIATLPRPRAGTIPWGGALAITRDVCDDLDLQKSWQNRLSDDLTLARLAWVHGIKVRPVRDLLIPSFIDNDDALWNFGIRQYRHLFCNVPSLWIVAFIITFVHSVSWIAVFISGNILALLAGYLAAWLRAILRIKVARKILPTGKQKAIGRVLLIDGIAPFVVVWFHLLLVIGGGSSRVIDWGGFRYRVRGGEVSSVEKIYIKDK